VKKKVQKCMQVSESRVQILGRLSVSISLLLGYATRTWIYKGLSDYKGVGTVKGGCRKLQCQVQHSHTYYWFASSQPFQKRKKITQAWFETGWMLVTSLAFDQLSSFTLRIGQFPQPFTSWQKSELKDLLLLG
jgi:hypothetical protein